MSHKPAYAITPKQRAALVKARQSIDYANNARGLRAYHVRVGHMVKDPTPDELVAIAKARAAKGQ